MPADTAPDAAAPAPAAPAPVAPAPVAAPPAAQVPQTPAPSADQLLAGSGVSRSSLNSALTADGVPNLLGDLLRSTSSVTFPFNLAGDSAGLDASGTLFARGTKVSENNTALPRTRFSARHNWFHNAQSVTGFGFDRTRPDGFVSSPVPAGTADNVTLDPATFAARFTPGGGFQNTVGILADAPGSRLGRTVIATGTDPGGNTVAILGDRTLQNGQVRPETRDFDVHLTTLAWEQAFLNDNMSFEVRVPFADRVNSDLDLIGSRRVDNDLAQIAFVEPTPGGTLGSSDTQLQDVQLILKALLLKSDRYAFTAGLASTLPTADDTSVLVRDAFEDRRQPGFGNRADVIRDRRFTIENETVALSPFLALSGAPTGRTFFNAFSQVDFALGQDSVTFEQTNVDLNAEAGVPSPNPAVGGGPDAVVTRSRDTAELQDQALLHLDIGGGYWLYRNQRRRRGVTGFALLGELHYTTTLDDADTASFQSNFQGAPVLTPFPFDDEDPAVVGNTANRLDFLNATVGAVAVFGQRATLSAGAGLPLRNDFDKPFDVELQVQYNLYLDGLAGRLGNIVR